MSPGVVSLRCPACTRPFLSLPQHSETLVACPHCGRAAPAGTFAPAGSPAVDSISQSLRQPPFQPAWQDPAPPHQTGAWPPAQPAPFTPPAAPEPQWPFIPPEAYPPPSPFSQPETYFVPLAQSSPPSQPYGETYDPFPPRNPERNIPLAIFILAILSFAGWMLWDNLQPPLAFEVPAVPHPSSEVPNSPPPPANDFAPILVDEPTPTSETVVRAAAPSAPAVDLAAAGEAAPEMLRALFKADSPAERESLIAEADLHRDSIARFFSGQPLKLISVIPSKVTPQLQAGQAIAPLFQVTTDANRHGALLRLIPQTSGGFLLDWPMFAETHQRVLGHFLDVKPTEPTWFHVCLKRSHALNLPLALRTRHLCFDLQASVDDSVRFYAGVEKETPLGRFLDRETEWGTVYVTRLLLQWRGVGTDEESVAIIDCEGSRAGGSTTPPASR